MDTFIFVASAASILGTVITVYNVFRLKHAVKTGFTLDIRRLINRIERNKEPFKQAIPDAYRELFDIQDELETVSKKFLDMFNIK